jgi:hypothetical protein
MTPPTITPLLVADLLAEGERMPVYVHVIDHPDARVLVDTASRSCTRRWPTSIPRLAAAHQVRRARLHTARG